MHQAWGTADKVTVIPNWAPLEEIEPRDRKNDWSVELQSAPVAAEVTAADVA